MRHPVQPTTPQSEAAARAPAAALATAGRVRAAALATAALAVTAALLAGPLYAGTPRLQMFFGSTFSDQAYSNKVYDRVAGAWTRPA